MALPAARIGWTANVVSLMRWLPTILMAVLGFCFDSPLCRSHSKFFYKTSVTVACGSIRGLCSMACCSMACSRYHFSS
ncbi:hypothetical protein F5Y12DRAFT_241401 [Xylaria sp. FL1777]|nr:hypothetical protein F5Y12DRAFT_241401 [Xylaria sp. FL1777]